MAFCKFCSVSQYLSAFIVELRSRKSTRIILLVSRLSRTLWRIEFEDVFSVFRYNTCIPHSIDCLSISTIDIPHPCFITSYMVRPRSSCHVYRNIPKKLAMQQASVFCGLLKGFSEPVWHEIYDSPFFFTRISSSKLREIRSKCSKSSVFVKKQFLRMSILIFINKSPD